ncbi:MAG: ATP synthase subunit C [Lachnospiraceae bacterium]|nr:ATP synthase subunit C [Lachnospiraceae bacterium]
MNMLVMGTLMVALILSFILPWGVYLAGERSRGRYKTSLAINVVAFFGLLMLTTVLMFTGNMTAYAEAEEVTTNSGFATGLAYISSALAVGMSGIGGGIAVASSASAALGAISEDSSVLGKSLIFVGLSEGVCLYGLVIAFMILGNV